MDFSGEIDGISKRDWAEFIGAAAPTYLMRMGQMTRRNGKISFMFSAFLCPQYYFAYRKMWLWAILGLVIDLAVYFVNVIQQVAQAGFMVFAWLSPDTLYMIYDVLVFLVLGIRIASGLFALYLYKQDATKKIVAISADFGTSPVYHEELRKKGGVSVLGVVLCVVLFMVFNYAVVAFIGVDAVNALYAYMNELMASLAI
ncbi:DUF2628 domain-containing protein [Ruminococcaceae bacterium OttesenSCG-928-D13]|nr:DUF2628 domain-containing protein [Ruminococcaceae bacterium OttesenSCG-928-D13]